MSPPTFVVMVRWLLLAVLSAVSCALQGQTAFTGTVQYRVALSEADEAIFGDAYPDSLTLTVTDVSLRLLVHGGVGHGLYLLLDSTGGWMVNPAAQVYTALPAEEPLKMQAASPRPGIPTDLLRFALHPLAAVSDSGRWQLGAATGVILPGWLRQQRLAPVWLQLGTELPLWVEFDYRGVLHLPKRVTYTATGLTEPAAEAASALPAGYKAVGPAKFYVTGTY